MDVIGVGDADMDIYLDVDHIPGRDEKLCARRVATYPGGMVANFLVALRRLGTPCGFHGLVGDDEFGRLTLADLVSNGVDTRGAIVREHGQTYFCVVMLDESGEKSLIVAPTDCMYPHPADLSASLIAQARHLHTAPDIIPTAASAIDIARANALTVSLDVEPRAAAQHRELWPLLAHVDLLFAREEAVKLLAKTASLDMAIDKIMDQGPPIICVTQGERGSLIASRASSVLVPAFPVPVVDSTGAGDAFAAAFVHGFLRQWPLEQAATFANAVGAMNVMHRGGHAGAPTLAEVTAFLAARGVNLPVA